MKILNRIAALICVLFLSACAPSAFAATYSPLQPADTGSWFDPGQSGAGFDIFSYSVQGAHDAAFVTFYGGTAADGWPVWFASQPEWHGVTVTAPLYQTTRAFGDNTSANTPAKVIGSVTFTANGQTCGSISADVTFADGSPQPGYTQHFDLVPIIQPSPDACRVCGDGDFSPVWGNCH